MIWIHYQLLGICYIILLSGTFVIKFIIVGSDIRSVILTFNRVALINVRKRISKLKEVSSYFKI